MHGLICSCSRSLFSNQRSTDLGGDGRAPQSIQSGRRPDEADAPSIRRNPPETSVGNVTRASMIDIMDSALAPRGRAYRSEQVDAVKPHAVGSVTSSAPDPVRASSISLFRQLPRIHSLARRCCRVLSPSSVSQVMHTVDAMPPHPQETPRWGGALQPGYQRQPESYRRIRCSRSMLS